VADGSAHPSWGVGRFRLVTQCLIVGGLSTALISLLVIQPTATYPPPTVHLRAVPTPRAASVQTPSVTQTVPSTTISTAPPTTAPPGPTTTTSLPIPTSENIESSGGHLVIDGKPYRFVGLNAYELATDWGTNAGCGGMLTDAQLNAFFASLRPNSLVRLWAFQGTMAMNVNTHQLDWGPLDRVFSSAAAHGQRLIVSLTDQGGTCDNGHWQDPSWYDGGFMDVFNDSSTTNGQGMTPMSYWDYLHAIVTHFRSSPALGM
jgi:mannan endo-1,4-beta-mannosidase